MIRTMSLQLLTHMEYITLLFHSATILHILQFFKARKVRNYKNGFINVPALLSRH